MTTTHPKIGELLREWRQRRHLSQLALACEADISARHLSFLETGRAQPSRDMVVHLAERMAVPLRERNRLLLAAGYAPLYPERSLDDPALEAARAAVRLVLTGHEPAPAIAVDRHWTLVAANDAVAPLIAGAAPALLKPPVNVLRLSLHPEGVAPRILNLPEWRAHVVQRLGEQVAASGDPVLLELMREIEGYPAPSDDRARGQHGTSRIAVPLQMASDEGTLSFISTITVFGTPVDVTLAELAIESFFPADAATVEILGRLARQREAERPAAAAG
jgi:transcriptional regulator with XRE-family HTH domain